MAGKISKELVVLNCQEVPETICVETRFITNSASKQKKYDKLYYITSTGNFELMPPEDEVVPARAIIPFPKTTMNSFAGVQQCQLSQVPGTMPVFCTPLTNQNNSNLTDVQNLNFPPLMASSNYLPFQPLDLNTPVLPATTVVNLNNLNTLREKNVASDIVQQCDVSTASNKKSTATQCKLDDEVEDCDIEWPEEIHESLKSPADLETKKEEFLKYVTENSTQHKNCKECLICGEISKSNKYFYGHMAIHQGPKVLCYKCGTYLDHKKLLYKHKCKKAKKLEKAFLQCPHYNCNVKTISPLELFDHINEHANNRMHKCSACHKGFCTSQEYLRHLLIRAKCYTNARKPRFCSYGLQSQRDRSCRVRVFTLHTFKKRATLVKSFLSKRVTKRGYCKICLIYFANNSVYNRHRIKCIAKFRKRLIRKKN